MNARTIWAIVKKDWLEVRQNTSAIASMVVVPVVFIGVLPLVVFIAVGASGQDPSKMSADMADLATMMANMPAGIAQYLAPWNDFQKGFVLLLGILFAPMFLILPLMSASVIAAESFAGEKERKTMEALLYTPASDAELFTGKVLAAFIPSLALTWLSFALYILVLNLGGWQFFGQVWFPLPMWWPLIFWVTPAIAALSIAFTVLISAKTRTFMEAYQMGAATVVLVLGLVVGQATGVLYLSPVMAFLVGLVFWAAAGVLAWFSIRVFNRTALLTN
jgi:ABC-2 type transport system permease protein